MDFGFNEVGSLWGNQKLNRDSRRSSKQTPVYAGETGLNRGRMAEGPAQCKTGGSTGTSLRSHSGRIKWSWSRMRQAGWLLQAIYEESQGLKWRGKISVAAE